MESSPKRIKLMPTAFPQSDSGGHGDQSPSEVKPCPTSPPGDNEMEPDPNQMDVPSDACYPTAPPVIPPRKVIRQERRKKKREQAKKRLKGNKKKKTKQEKKRKRKGKREHMNVLKMKEKGEEQGRVGRGMFTILMVGGNLSQGAGLYLEGACLSIFSLG